MKTFSKKKERKVCWAYLNTGLSQRKIEAEILGIPYKTYGGGWVAFRILHSYGITKADKGRFTKKEGK